jgi:cytochrome P450
MVQALAFALWPIRFLEGNRRRFGDTFTARLAGGDSVFISDPESVKHLLSGTSSVSREGPLAFGSASLFVQEGEEHLRSRRLMLPRFHGERLRTYEETIEAVTTRTVEGWPAGRAFALHPSMRDLTLEVILRTVFGIQSLERMRVLQRDMGELLAIANSRASMALALPVVRRLRRAGRFEEIFERFDSLVATEIAERRADPELERREDIFSMLIAARFDDGTAMGDDELRDQLIALLLAGHDTTATSLAWAFELLLHHPAELARLLEELDSDRHEYLDAVVNESLRLRPVVPTVDRVLTQPVTLAGYELDAGTTVNVANYLLHTRPDLYPDPYAFRPERFLESPPGTYSWTPFGGGTRRCIAAAFAQFEMRVAIGKILRSVELRSASSAPERPVRRKVNLAPARGTRVVVAGRR